MRLRGFYLAAAFTTFTIGASVGVLCRAPTSEKPAEKTQSESELKIEKNTFDQNFQSEPIGRGFGTGAGYLSLNEPPDMRKVRPTCRDKKLLPVWNVLKNDSEFKERAKFFYGNADCTTMFKIKRLDLNDDGRSEFLLWGQNFNLCGATGNCALWIYEKRGGNKYRLLLRTTALLDGEYEGFEVKKGKQRGYQNLLLKGHFSGYETDHRIYRFNGSRYIETKCWFEISTIDAEKTLIKSCREYLDSSK